MNKTYKGQPVTVVRAATEGDKGFAAGVGAAKPAPQSLVKLSDGTTKVVADSELTE